MAFFGYVADYIHREYADKQSGRCHFRFIGQPAGTDGEYVGLYGNWSIRKSVSASKAM